MKIIDMEKKGPAKKDTAIDPLQHCRMYRIKIKGKSDLLNVMYSQTNT